MASDNPTTWSARLRRIPPSTLSGSPKSITQGSIPALCRIPTAPSSRVTSHMLADIIIGCTISTGGPAFLRRRLSGGKYRRSRYIGTLSTIWNGEGTDSVSRPPSRSTSRPFCAVATNRPTGLMIGPVIAERFRSTRCSPTTVYCTFGPDGLHIMAHTAHREAGLEHPPFPPTKVGRVAHLLGAEALHLEYPTQVVFDSVTVGVNEGDRIGIVGRNGDGKSSLLGLLAGRIAARFRPGDAPRRRAGRRARPGRHPRRRPAPSVGNSSATRPSTSGPATRGSATSSPAWWPTSPGTRRSATLSAAASDAGSRWPRCWSGDWDVIALDEPTNHLDVEGITWLAAHLKRRWARSTGGLLVVTHDRWFLDEVAPRRGRCTTGSSSRSTAATPRTSCSASSATGSRRGDRGQAAEPDAQGAGLAAPRRARRAPPSRSSASTPPTR